MLRRRLTNRTIVGRHSGAVGQDRGADFFLRSLLFVLVVFSMFPYVRVLPIPTDIQPNAMLVAVVVVFSQLYRVAAVPKFIYLYFLAVVCVAAIPGGSPMHILRGVVSAISFGILFVAWYLAPLDILSRILRPFFLLAVSSVYLIGVLIQRYVNPDALSIFISRDIGYGGIGGRGNESFTAEPTFLGIHMLIVMYIGWRFAHRNGWVWLFYIISTLVIVWGSKSSTAIVTLGIFVFFYFLFMGLSVFRTRLTGYKLLQLFGALSLVVVTGIVMWYMSAGETDTRFGALVTKFFRGGFFAVINEDASVADRFGHMWISITEAFKSFLIPHGYGNFYSVAIAAAEVSNLRLLLTGAGHGRVMSFYGGLLFELGLFGLIPFCYITKSLFAPPWTTTVLATGVAFTILLLQAVPLSHPLLPLIAVIYYKRFESRGGMRGNS